MAKKEEMIEKSVEKIENKPKKSTTNIKKKKGATEKERNTEKKRANTSTKKTTSTNSKVSTSKKSGTNTKKSTNKKNNANIKKNANNDKKKSKEEKKENKKAEAILEEKVEELEKVEKVVEGENEKKAVLKIEEIKKAFKEKKKIPKEEMEKIYKILFKNMLIAAIIILYFMFLNLGHMNIKNEVYVIDLKVFGMCTLLTGIVLIEIAYKKDEGRTAVHGIEMIVLSIATISLIYINLMLSSRFECIVPAISYIFAIYYLIKSIIIYQKERKKYFVNDMKEIMDKEE